MEATKTPTNGVIVLGSGIEVAPRTPALPIKPTRQCRPFWTALHQLPGSLTSSELRLHRRCRAEPADAGRGDAHQTHTTTSETPRAKKKRVSRPLLDTPRDNPCRKLHTSEVVGSAINLLGTGVLRLSYSIATYQRIWLGS